MMTRELNHLVNPTRIDIAESAHRRSSPRFDLIQTGGILPVSIWSISIV